MRKSRTAGSKRRAQASLVYAIAVMSSFILSGMSPLAVVGALESTEKMNREDLNAPRVLQDDNQYLRLKGQSELSLHQRRDDRQLVTNKEKKTKTVLRTAQNKVKMKSASDSVKQPKITMVTKAAGQSTRTKVKNPLKEQMIRARLEKRAKKKRQKMNPSDSENYSSEAKTFLGNLELKWHQQVGKRDKSDWYDRRSGKPSGGWNNNRWSSSRRPGGNRPGGKPTGWKPQGWESNRWKPSNSKPRDRWSGETRNRDRWSGGGEWWGKKNNWAKPCRCTYIDPVEETGSSWSWTGSSWSWGGNQKMKVCTCEPTYEPTYYPTYHPTNDLTYRPTRLPTVNPTLYPTLYPTQAPTLYPTLSPTAKEPTMSPTLYPTLAPTVPEPTKSPSLPPTMYPTLVPTLSPTLSPTKTPSIDPTRSPTMMPTITPTTEPTSSPTITPTETPTMSPTFTPTESPTFSPTVNPTINPTESPTFTPTEPEEE